jgi:hypothetical protein
MSGPVTFFAIQSDHYDALVDAALELRDLVGNTTEGRISARDWKTADAAAKAAGPALESVNSPIKESGVTMYAALLRNELMERVLAATGHKTTECAIRDGFNRYAEAVLAAAKGSRLILRGADGIEEDVTPDPGREIPTTDFPGAMGRHQIMPGRKVGKK